MEQNQSFSRQKRAKSASNHKQKKLVILGSQAVPEDLFARRLEDEAKTLCRDSISTLQLNLGKMCNLTCTHCHVEAGPNRKEHMSEEILEHLLVIAREHRIQTVDLTGGAPEMCPGFRMSVQAFHELGVEILVRSNLTILVEPGYEDMVEFFSKHQVKVIASLPCYSRENVDTQRGEGVFGASIEAIKRLNAAGYGLNESGLELDLVYNPGSPSLPGPEQQLEQAYKKNLFEDFGVVFNRLYCITNLPIGRFYSDLKKRGEAEAYDALLRDNFNPSTVNHLMCRSTLNVSWDGWLYDCDFNQMIELPMRAGAKPLHVSDLSAIPSFTGLPIQTGNHCFGCTAGAGSSCGGELVDA